MNYQIIKDGDKLDEFIEWLPELEKHERYFIGLFARKKYAPQMQLRNGEQQIKRIITEKKYIKDKIRQLEIIEGGYKDNGNPIPQEALVVYITPNPRCLIKATKSTLKELLDKMLQDGYTNYNPYSTALTEIHRAKSRGVFVEFDFDCPEGYHIKEFVEDTTSEIADYINKEACTFIRTRGGVHVLVEPDKVEDKYKKSFYKAFMKIEGFDQKGDNMIPIPGTTQGNFVPHFI